ncbi:MAG: hypothetical protein MR902_04700 [Campylobacter sp.]|nr:hypothetical protein [Campylobacter sp.]
MNSLKTHFGVILPLICLLFCVQFTFFISNISKDYQQIMKTNYSIVVVSKKDLSSEAAIAQISAIDRLEIINPNETLMKLKGKISDTNLEKISQNLPNFYNVKLQFFPNSSDLDKISKALNNIDGVDRVEIFSKAHDFIYNIFLLAKQIIYIFTFLVLILGVILIFKQIRIWIYEHKERIDILNLFGASFLFKSMVLYKMVLIDSIIATLVVIAFFYLVPNNEYYINFMREVELNTATISFPNDIFWLFGLSVGLSLLAVTMVMFKVSKEQK